MTQTDDFKPLNLSVSKEDKNIVTAELKPVKLIHFLSSKSFHSFSVFLPIFFLALIVLRIISIIADFRFELGEGKAFEDGVNIFFLIVIFIITITNIQPLKAASKEDKFDEQSFSTLKSFFKGISIFFFLAFLYNLYLYVLLLLASSPMIILIIYPLYIFTSLIGFGFWINLSKYMGVMLSYSKISDELKPDYKALKFYTYVNIIYTAIIVVLFFFLIIYSDSLAMTAQLILNGSISTVHVIFYVFLSWLLQKYNHLVGNESSPTLPKYLF